MTDESNARTRELDSLLQSVPDLPVRALETYARLWQLETWLRRLVYTELRAAHGDDWSASIPSVDRARNADKRLTHMPTPEDDLLSFARFADVQAVISGEWRLFDPFLPPKPLWEAKLEEVTQVRHRVAHFRRGHRDDLQRVTQLLRDLDHGFWSFCTSFNDPQPVLPQSDDPVVSEYLHLDLIPWTQLSDGKWARIGAAHPSEPLFVTVEVLRRPWATWSTPVAGQPGLVYYVTLHARGDRCLDYRQLLEHTKATHQHLIYVSLESGSKAVRITIPAVLGAERVIQLIGRFVEASLYAATRSTWTNSDAALRALVEASPAHVIGPENPLSFLSPDMPCSLFGV